MKGPILKRYRGFYGRLPKISSDPAAAQQLRYCAPLINPRLQSGDHAHDTTSATVSTVSHITDPAHPLAQLARDTLADNELPDGTLPKDNP